MTEKNYTYINCTKCEFFKKLNVLSHGWAWKFPFEFYIYISKMIINNLYDWIAYFDYYRMIKIIKIIKFFGDNSQPKIIH